MKRRWTIMIAALRWIQRTGSAGMQKGPHFRTCAGSMNPEPVLRMHEKMDLFSDRKIRREDFSRLPGLTTG